MTNRTCYFIATILLLAMLLMAVFSLRDDCFTFDEVAHVVAGYSYLTQKDMRLNPEHPPLIKDLAAIPLLFSKINFPKDHSSWIQEENPVWWYQFELGFQFLYRSGNNPEQILFFSRLPMILLLVFLGWLIFFWTKQLFGNKAGLFSLFFFTFSPTFLAHGRLVTTDVGAALGVVLGSYFWIRFLKNPSKKNVVLAGLVFGVVMLLKFTLILLIPFFAFITTIYALLKDNKKRLPRVLRYAGLALLSGIIAVVFVIWPVYQYHVTNYPHERQIRDAQFLLSTAFAPKPLIELDKFLISNPSFRALGQYLLGIILVLNRSETGNTTYFLGEISAAGSRIYFPVVYLIKEPLAFHLFTIIALLGWAISVKKPFWQNTFPRIRDWIKDHFEEFAFISFILLYWLISLKSNLNIGVRHLLPLFPFTIMLVSAKIASLCQKPYFRVKCVLVFVLLFWQMFSVISVYPHFLAYFNSLAGGPKNGYLYVVDSNLDWGQDLKRLKKWADAHNIEKLYVDYFGGGNPEYYLKEKYLPWWGTREPREFEKPNYLAVSASQLQGGKGFPAPGFDQKWGYYLWLEQYQPVAKIGYSIFIYWID